MLKVYGSRLCPDCVECLLQLDAAGVEYQYLDFSDNLKYLKEFLVLRDLSPAFSEFRGKEQIGIPCIMHPDGTLRLSWDDLLNQKG